MNTFNRFARLALLSSASLTFAMGLGCDVVQAAQDTNSSIEMVTVTANKRVENIQDVPISIVPLGGDVLGKTSSSNLTALQQYVPGLVISNVSGDLTSNTYLRGNGTNQLNAGGDPAVAYFVDEVYISGKSGLQFDLLDVDRIDVLKGPQGTLFGRNAAAGAISIATKKPSDEFDFTSDSTIGDYGLYTERASVTGPINGTDGHWLYRFSGGYESRDGFTRNLAAGDKPVDNVSVGAGRGDLEWVGNSFKFLLSVDGQVMRDGMPASLISTAADTDLLPFPEPLPPPFNCPGISPYHQCFNSPGFQDQDVYSVTGRAEWTTDIGVVTSISAFRHSRFDLAQDNDGTDVNFLYSAFSESDTQFSQEIRLANQELPNSRISWVVGAYYLYSHIRENGFYSVGGGAVTENDFNIFGTHSYAVFGQAAFDVTDKLTLTAGARYTTDDKTDFRTFSVDGFPFYTVTPSGKWDAINPAATVSYKFMPTLMAYASYRQGFISGGFQDLFPSSQAAAETPFKPEIANTYEAGVKSSWFDDRLVADAEAFSMNYEFLQVQQTQALGGAGGFSIVTNNAGAARDNGIDLSIIGRPVAALTLAANMTFQHATYTNYQSPPGTPLADQFDYTGHYIPNSPDFSAAYSAQYDFGLFNGATLAVRGEYNYRSMYFTHPANPSVSGTFQPGFGLANLLITYIPPSDMWEVEFWAKNLANTHYYASISNAVNVGGPGVELALAELGEPLTFGAQLHIHLQ